MGLPRGRAKLPLSREYSTPARPRVRTNLNELLYSGPRSGRCDARVPGSSAAVGLGRSGDPTVSRGRPFRHQPRSTRLKSNSIASDSQPLLPSTITRLPSTMSHHRRLGRTGRKSGASGLSDLGLGIGVARSRGGAQAVCRVEPVVWRGGGLGWARRLEAGGWRAGLLSGGSGRLQRPQPLDVVRPAHEPPLAADLLDAAQQEPAEAHHALDNAEHRLDRLLALGVRPSA